MKTFKGILYGIAIAIAVSAGAATVYNYFPPPGMTYSPTTGFVVGSATGGAQGAGSINAQSMFINGAAVATGGSVPSSANPTASVGLTAVNGSGTAYMLANAAPALSQSITPTWTGAHIFSPASGVGITINAVAGSKAFRATGAAGDYAGVFTNVNTAGSSFGLLVQAGTNSSDFALRVQNTGAGSDYIRVFGDGGTVAGNPTGGDQGVGTINMQGCFVNGVACSTGGAAGANPTGTVGLTAVNGVAGTYMRSDAAPPLSQSITPTWTGTHTFNNTTANVVLNNAGGALNTKNTLLRESTAGFLVQSATDAAPTTAVTSVFTASRTGTAWTGINFGNATDNPTYSFLGTGQVTTSGNVTVNAPPSGVALTATGCASCNTALFQANTGAGTSFGPIVQAGTNSSDINSRFLNASGGANYLEIFGDGGVIVGNPTGGDKGVGTVNAQAVYVNGVATGAIVCTTACNASGLLVGQSVYTSKSGGSTSRSGTTTDTIDPDLQFTNVPVGLYQINYTFEFGSAAGAGFKFQLVSSGADNYISGVAGCNTATAYFTPPGSDTQCSATNGGMVSGTGFVRVTSTGTVSINWAQISSNATPTVLFLESNMSLTRVN